MEERIEGKSLLPLTRGVLSDEDTWRDYVVSELDYSFRGARLTLGRAPGECRGWMVRDAPMGGAFPSVLTMCRRLPSCSIAPSDERSATKSRALAMPAQTRDVKRSRSAMLRRLSRTSPRRMESPANSSTPS